MKGVFEAERWKAVPVYAKDQRDAVALIRSKNFR